MIHVADTLFNPSRFIEAFRMHTSTSPNYQIVASLDIARRQAALEGFHRVRGALFLALQLRRRIQSSSLLRPYFRVLDDDELIPAQYREHTGAASAPVSLSALSARWGRAGFVIDPTHITLDISGTGLDGPGFRQLLMTRYDIQVNKTSRNTVLLLITIGATQATIDYLVQVLSEMAALFAAEQHASDTRQALKAAVLPEARVFHRAFLPFGAMRNSPLDLRTAHADGNDEAHTEHAPLSAGTMLQVESGRTLVSATFVTPYPPGFPVLVPGQIITAEILTFFQNLKIPEIHGLNPEHGFRIFRQDWLNARLSTTDQAAHTGTSIST
jgi:arginine decarboxylase